MKVVSGFIENLFYSSLVGSSESKLKLRLQETSKEEEGDDEFISNRVPST